MLVACAPAGMPCPQKRVKRARRAFVTKRFGNLKKINEEMKRIAKEEREALNEFFLIFFSSKEEED